LTIAAKTKPVETTSPVIAATDKPIETASPVVAADEPVVTRRRPPVIIIAVLGILAVAAGMVVYKKKATV